MIDVRNFLENPVSLEELEAFLEFISDNEGTGKSSCGQELEFFERNDFDPVIANNLYSDFPYWVSKPFSPLSVQRPDGGYYESEWIEGSYDRDESYSQNGRDRAYCYGVALQLRNYFRDKFGKPRLSKEEIKCFKFGAFPWKNSDKVMPEKFPCYSVSDEEAKLAFDYACKYYPEFVRYHRGLDHLVSEQGYKSYDVVGRSITTGYINDSLMAVVPGIGQYGWFDVGDYFFELVNNYAR
jgi:hypothetical protein